VSTLWNGFDVAKQKSILTRFVDVKLTDMTHIQILDFILTSNNRESKEIKEHQEALKVQINNANETTIKRITDTLIKNSVSRTLWMKWINEKQYDKPQEKAGKEADEEQ
jgi:hypothetical protein